MNDQKFFDVKGVAVYTTLSRSTIYKMVMRGQIPFRKIGKRTIFDKEEIDNWIHNQGVMMGNIPEL